MVIESCLQEEKTYWSTRLFKPVDSERQVPTGPDPLHHNHYPLGP
uniref:Uncharacterized protein n=1 Tax=Nelumbo nucifera TaxID=4432 RepID=A0A822Z771_NELNU|nr:TPA_asm: hypothetical protein HUJ06_000474 [Nelumbo nucifera]